MKFLRFSFLTDWNGYYENVYEIIYVLKILPILSIVPYSCTIWYQNCKVTKVFANVAKK